MKELYHFVWKIQQQKVSQADLQRALELINEAEDEEWIPVALQYHYCKMIILDYIHFYQHFVKCTDLRAD